MPTNCHLLAVDRLARRPSLLPLPPPPPPVRPLPLLAAHVHQTPLSAACCVGLLRPPPPARMRTHAHHSHAPLLPPPLSPSAPTPAANSASLADGLRAIISSRASQENFQLIIITHDERFARAIGTHEYAETMWRVTKDVNQHTLVEPEDITDDS